MREIEIEKVRRGWGRVESDADAAVVSVSFFFVFLKPLHARNFRDKDSASKSLIERYACSAFNNEIRLGFKHRERDLSHLRKVSK